MGLSRCRQWFRCLPTVFPTLAFVAVQGGILTGVLLCRPALAGPSPSTPWFRLPSLPAYLMSLSSF